MLRILISKLNIDSDLELELLAQLNEYELTRVGNSNLKSRKQKLVGFYLLKKQLDYFEQTNSVKDLKRNEFHKPFFLNTFFDFSISYSKEYVVCMASVQAKVGVDIEFNDLKQVNFESPFFSKSEQIKLKESKNIFDFYVLHTRKEAFSKAVGKEIFLPFEEFDTTCKTFYYNDKIWNFETVSPLGNYTLSYVSDFVLPMQIDLLAI
ncbi:4'-phosphopantetheinyl transferase family protein [Flavobacterium sp. 7A]|uniref:4'-phosphopantetheinyl transferase family protein n=1 Tax=Flavobacterium sp. 7A TaxID=2940571 RepID=UPI0022273B5C|nr:4'-phosphopantetheinyl transferase superfamily protein [Flavobacterium sp. 7A]MCW2118730.1 phosphopantetheinyl transferase [Flavobacterium sp. 7A]